MRALKIFGFIFLLLAVWVASFCVNTMNGGYYLKDDIKREWDADVSRIKYSIKIHWQPRIGFLSQTESDIIGYFYRPLIYFDRRWFHPSIDLLSSNSENALRDLDLSQIHPDNRKLVSQIKAKAGKEMGSGENGTNLREVWDDVAGLKSGLFPGLPRSIFG